MPLAGLECHPLDTLDRRAEALVKDAFKIGLLNIQVLHRGVVSVETSHITNKRIIPAQGRVPDETSTRFAG